MVVLLVMVFVFMAMLAVDSMTNFHLDNSLLSCLIYADYFDNEQNKSIIRESLQNSMDRLEH